MLKECMKDNCMECGIDEVGRGALCGPVVAACVIWGSEGIDPIFASKIRDSKKMTPKERTIMSDFIKDNAVDWSVSFVDSKRIDEINILNATFEAMHQCLESLTVPIDHILVDGNRFKQYKDIPFTCVVKGDSEYMSIAAASIIAKVARDEYMKRLCEDDDNYCKYGWVQNQGYGTKQHLEAIKKFGLTDYHRKTFHLKSKSPLM